MSMNALAGNHAHARAERQPHIYGALPYQYRQGTSSVNADTPPAWTPEQAHDPVYPYTLEEYKIDIDRWLKATKVTPERQGPLIATAVGGAARIVLDAINSNELSRGTTYDFNDGQGMRFYSGVEQGSRSPFSRKQGNPHAAYRP